MQRDPIIPHTLAVSGPGGGLPRQYRVQYQSTSEEHWRLYGTYRNAQQAQACVHLLHDRGYKARFVPYSISPAAA